MTINTQQLNFILDNTPADQNIMLIGKHGIGKSRILEDYFTAHNAKVVTLFLGQLSDPGDLIGLPHLNEETGQTEFMLPYWFPVDGKPVVLFLDELNRARPEIMQCIMDLTLNRKLAGKSLPEGSRIISAVNNGSEYQLTDLDPALVSRFNLYTFEPSVEDWLYWAENSGIDNRIIRFITENPEFLDSLEQEQQTENLEKTPDRRSWERVSNIITKFPQLSDIHKPVISGIIGNRATVSFFKFVLENNYPGAKEILCDDFSKVEQKLKNITGIVFTQINEDLYRFIESQSYSDALYGTIASNLVEYFNFLEKQEFTEFQSHFASLCSAEIYPNTLNFITLFAPDLYQKIIEFIASL